jgi:hypothetical protein
LGEVGLLCAKSCAKEQERDENEEFFHCGIVLRFYFTTLMRFTLSPFSVVTRTI